MHCDCSVQQPRQTALLEIQSKLFNTITERVIESVCINGVSVLSGLNLEKILGLSFPRANQTVHSNEVSTLGGCP